MYAYPKHCIGILISVSFLHLKCLHSVQVEIHDVNEAMRLIESSKDSLLRHQANKGYTQNTVDRVYAAIRAMAEGSKTLKVQEIRDRYLCRYVSRALLCDKL
jgi:hypothetical protein